MVKKEEERSSDFVKLGGSIGGLMIASVVLFLVFASEYIELLIPLAWAFVVLGVVLGFFQYKAMATRKRTTKK
ncbi:MAG: hypothetical protein ACLFTH_01780 [Candidatus Woesearchaeota archaeon]